MRIRDYRITIALVVMSLFTHAFSAIYLSVKDFGAKGDGTTSSYRAFKMAIDSLHGKGTIFIPKDANSYVIDTGLIIGSNSSDSHIMFEFETGATIKSNIVGKNAVLFYFKNFPSHFNMQGMRGARILSTLGNGIAIKLNGQCFGKFEDLYIEGFNIGIMLSDEGKKIFSEFNLFNHLELHFNHTAVVMTKDGDAEGIVRGTDVSFHGCAFKNTSCNIGDNQTGFQFIDAAWYNADFDIKFTSSNTGSAPAIIKMSTSAAFRDLKEGVGVFGSGSITCENPAKIIGKGRFWFNGQARFINGLIDSLDPVNPWEMGFYCTDYIKEQKYGAPGSNNDFNVSELNAKSDPNGSNGPFGSMARLRKKNVESILANCYAAHAANPGNGFYTGYTGWQNGYSSGVLGWFLASDGTEMKSYAPNGTNCIFRAGADGNPYGDNIAFGIKDGKFLVNGKSTILSGSLIPNGHIKGSIGDMYLCRSPDTNAGLWIKQSSDGNNTGWIHK